MVSLNLKRVLLGVGLLVMVIATLMFFRAMDRSNYVCYESKLQPLIILRINYGLQRECRRDNILDPTIRYVCRRTGTFGSSKFLYAIFIILSLAFIGYLAVYISAMSRKLLTRIGTIILAVLGIAAIIFMISTTAKLSSDIRKKKVIGNNVTRFACGSEQLAIAANVIYVLAVVGLVGLTFLGDDEQNQEQEVANQPYVDQQQAYAQYF